MDFLGAISFNNISLVSFNNISITVREIQTKTISCWDLAKTISDYEKNSYMKITVYQKSKGYPGRRFKRSRLKAFFKISQNSKYRDLSCFNVTIYK